MVWIQDPAYAQRVQAVVCRQKINDEVLDAVLRQHAPNDADIWKKRMLATPYSKGTLPRIGSLRAFWKKHYRMDIDATTHSLLFRILCSYLDQGISMWHFPVWNKGFLASLEELENNSYTSFFRTERARQLLLEGTHSITHLLKILVGDPRLYTHYLFDQQFAHQGWSGLVSMIEDQPETLLDKRKISLHDLIYFELLLR
ncbi:MAG: DUF2309 domain-containing protein [Bacteroidia bacterium]|nr:DUF2309 domain-containing protein [Bacteroidia bacterium]